MKIFLVRHGESEANAKGLSQGNKDEWEDTNLSKNGKEQAKKVAKRLKDEKFDVIYSSDLKRAEQTAEEINKFHKVKIKLDKRLRDILIDENLEEFIEKIKGFFEDIEKEKGNVLIVAHGSSCLTFLAVTTGSREEGDKIIERHKGKHCNTAVSILERQGDKYTIKLIGCAKHLGD